MISNNRRAFLRRTGALFAGGMMSHRVTAGGETQQFIVNLNEVSMASIRNSDLHVVYDLDSIHRAVVRGSERAVRQLTTSYEVDFSVSEPFPVTAPRRNVRSTQNRINEFQWDKRAQHILAAQEISTGKNTRVAVIDSGVQADHLDLRSTVNITLSKNFTGDSFGVGKAYGGFHGTAVAGVIAANGSTYFLGTAPDTEIIDCRVFGYPPNSGARSSDYLAALVYSADIGCDVANISLGPSVDIPARRILLERLATANIARYARENEMLITVAAGNDAINLSQFRYISFLNEPNVLIVSATGPIGFGWPINDVNGDGEFSGVEEIESPLTYEKPPYTPAWYTNFGSGVIDIAAPGGNVDRSAEEKNVPGWFLDMLPVDYVTVDFDHTSGFVFENSAAPVYGTSFAAPQVAGAAALIRSLRPEYSASQVRTVLKETAMSVEGQTMREYYGSGFIDPFAAVHAES